MVLMAGYDLPLRAIRQQVASALDLIIQLERVHDGSRKVMAITEVQRMESDVITLQELYRFQVDAVASDRAVVGQLTSTGLRPGFLEKFAKRGVKLPSWLSASPALGQVPHPPDREAAA
jgi:pilus assembly protein CpaF